MKRTKYIFVEMVINLISVLALAFTFTTSTNGLDVHCLGTSTDRCLLERYLNIDKPTTLNFIGADEWNNATRFVIGSGGNITIMPSGIFERFRNLKEVSITSTGLKSIEKDDFKNADNLENLILLENKVQVLTNGVFSKAPKLYLIDLDDNKLRTIEDFAFNGLNELGRLSLKNNNLAILKRNTFSGAPILNSLNLDDNQIDTIEDGAFDLPELKYLHLSGNRLRTLSDNVFVGATSLSFIGINKNRLTHIGQSFYKVEKLYFLELNGNQITDIDLRSFEKLPELRYLSLSNSGLRFRDNIDITPNTVISKVNHLDITDNNLTNSDIMARLEGMGYLNLETLLMNNNEFTAIDGIYEIKQSFPNITSLGLYGNQLSSEFYQNIKITLKEHEISVT